MYYNNEFSGNEVEPSKYIFYNLYDFWYIILKDGKKRHE